MCYWNDAILADNFQGTTQRGCVKKIFDDQENNVQNHCSFPIHSAVILISELSTELSTEQARKVASLTWTRLWCSWHFSGVGGVSVCLFPSLPPALWCMRNLPLSSQKNRNWLGNSVLYNFLTSHEPWVLTRLIMKLKNQKVISQVVIFLYRTDSINDLGLLC